MNIHYMPHKIWASYLLRHSCLIWAVIFTGSPKDLKETYKAGFDEILRNIQAQSKTVSYKRTFSSLVGLESWSSGFLLQYVELCTISNFKCLWIFRLCLCDVLFWTVGINYEQGSIVVRAHASHAEGLGFEPDSMPWLNARSMFTQQQMGT